MKEVKKLGKLLLEHDFKNENTKIKGFSELMKMTKKSRWKRNWIESIYRSSVKIQKLTELMSSYDRLDEGPRPVKVGVEFRKAIQFYPELEDKITFINRCEGFKVKIHPGLLTHLFYGLINNSLKHAGDISKISFLCKKEKGIMIYRDDGIGVAPAKKKQIFEKGYSQGTSSGLGLYLTKKICENYGWKLKETGIYGEGLELTFFTSDHQ